MKIFTFLFFSFCGTITYSQVWEVAVEDAIKNEDLNQLNQLIDSTNVNNSISVIDGNALLYAIKFQSPKSVKFLLEKKADPDYIFNSRTPLMYAVQHNDVSIVKSLLKHGASINITDSLGNTALMIAATNPRISFVKFLIRKGAALNIRNKKGYTARDFAIRSNNKAISAYLKNMFEKNLPNYFDGPYIALISKRKIKTIYIKHDSLKRRTDSYSEYFKIKELKGNFRGYAGDTLQYSIATKFSKPPAELTKINKLLVISDVHGQYDTLCVFLKNHKVVDKNLHWTFENGTIVFMGDIFDRGEKVTEALWLIYRLEKEAAKQGGSVQLLLGNHELMVMENDIRFISDKYYYLFSNLKLNYSRYYNNKTLLGKWLRSKNTILKIDSLLFVHGGIHPNLLQFNVSLDSINNLIVKYLSGNDKNKLLDNSTLQFLLSYNGPFWYRGMVERADGPSITEEELDKILQRYEVKHIVVGHTFHSDIKLYNGGKIISTDIPFYLPDGSPMQSLLFENNNVLLLNSQGERCEFKIGTSLSKKYGN